MLHSYTQLHTKHVDLAQVAILDMNYNFLIYFSVALLIFQTAYAKIHMLNTHCIAEYDKAVYAYEISY